MRRGPDRIPVLPHGAFLGTTAWYDRNEMSPQATRQLCCIDLGRMDYARALELQKQRVAALKAGDDAPEALLLVEHDPPAITLGRGSDAGNILASPEQLAAAGVEVHEISRGGEVTWHGPGQLVGYPILRLDTRGRDLHEYLRDLEEVLLRTLGRLGLAGRRVEGLTGVWVGREKVAAIGVAVSRWVSYHGFALNVCCDLSQYEWIVPCGIADRGVTSLSRLLGRDVSLSEIKPIVVECFAEVFGFDQLEKGDWLGSEADVPVPFFERRFPPWLTKRLDAGRQWEQVHRLLKDLGLETVCAGAHCPNQAECYAAKTATFLILGERCTRACRFCAIGPLEHPAPPRAEEPEAVAEASARLGLRHVVVTSVTRDDLADGGAGHFAATIRAVRRRLPAAVIEVLTPDFQGSRADIATVIDARPDIFNHNVETVPRLYAQVRPQADYRRSLAVLAVAKRLGAGADQPLYTKSGLMVGLGEDPEEVRSVLRDLREAACDMLTIGQYLAPSSEHLPVARFVRPEEFDAWKAAAREMGFLAVAAGPFVRSSYHAETFFRNLMPPRLRGE